MGEKDKNKPEQAPPPPPPKKDEKQEEHHHHGKDFAKRMGNAVTFGAGATIGSNAVNGIIRNI